MTPPKKQNEHTSDEHEGAGETIEGGGVPYQCGLRNRPIPECSSAQGVATECLLSPLTDASTNSSCVNIHSAPDKSGIEGRRQDTV